MSREFLSPITLKEVPYKPMMLGDARVMTYDHTKDGFGTLYYYKHVDEDNHEGKAFTNSKTGVRYSLEDTQNAWLLVRSYLWRAEKLGLDPILITSLTTQDQVVKELGRSWRFTPVPFEQLIAEARALTLVDKALNTLQNLYALYKSDPKPFNLNYSTPKTFAPMGMVFKPLGPGQFEDGQAYGCDEVTALFAYEYLGERGYIREHWVGQTPDGWLISSKGYDAIDRLRKGKASLGNFVFLVRRWDTELDTFLNPVMKDAEDQLKTLYGSASIDPVWRHEHNEKIDERIFRSIREAAVVLVDVSPDKYNVGLEHGYAMALGKPIVVIREGKDDWESPPFDINTQNVYDYRRTPEGAKALVAKIVSRVGIEFEKAKYAE